MKPANPSMSVAVVDPDISYETVAASQTAQVLGGAGAKGDFLYWLVVIPATVAGGVVTLTDGTTDIPVYVGGGVTALNTVAPFVIPINAPSKTGPWKVTTGASVSVVAVGNFTL